MCSIRPQPSALLHIRFAPSGDNDDPMRFGFPWLLLTKADFRVGFAQQSYG
jgi:hypothetical protein